MHVLLSNPQVLQYNDIVNMLVYILLRTFSFLLIVRRLHFILSQLHVHWLYLTLTAHVSVWAARRAALFQICILIIKIPSYDVFFQIKGHLDRHGKR